MQGTLTLEKIEELLWSLCGFGDGRNLIHKNGGWCLQRATSFFFLLFTNIKKRPRLTCGIKRLMPNYKLKLAVWRTLCPSNVFLFIDITNEDKVEFILFPITFS